MASLSLSLPLSLPLSFYFLFLPLPCSLLRGFVMLMQTDVADSQWFFICQWREIKGEWRGVAIVLTVRLSVTNKLLHCTSAIFCVPHLHLQTSTSSCLLKVYAFSLGPRRCEIKTLGTLSFSPPECTDCTSVCIHRCGAATVCAWVYMCRTYVRAVEEILPYSIYASVIYLSECHLSMWHFSPCRSSASL